MSTGYLLSVCTDGMLGLHNEFKVQKVVNAASCALHLYREHEYTAACKGKCHVVYSWLAVFCLPWIKFNSSITALHFTFLPPAC